ncbi:NUDIX hydrolase domain [Trinorchestia longiramus]|nr:NUDIX hydrolase domain [Trinorchestia longiramus]
MLVSSKSSSEVWLVPGGGLEEGEEAEEAALREAYEEAGIRGTILAYLGLFESRPEMNTSGKKHRTAVYVIKVTKEEDDFPEFKTHGRQRKWMSVDDALLHLSCNRPRQSVYLQLLRATRLKGGSIDDSTCSKSSETVSSGATVDQCRTIQVLQREDSDGSVVADDNVAIYQEVDNDEETVSVEILPDLSECEAVDIAGAIESQCLIDEVPHETTLTDSDSDPTEQTSSKSSTVSTSNESLVTPNEEKYFSSLGEGSHLKNNVLKSAEKTGADVFSFENSEAGKIDVNDDTFDEVSEAEHRTCSGEPLCSEMSFSVNGVQQIYY